MKGQKHLRRLLRLIGNSIPKAELKTKWFKMDYEIFQSVTESKHGTIDFTENMIPPIIQNNKFYNDWYEETVLKLEVNGKAYCNFINAIFTITRFQ